jgi:hypothetical protein
MNLAGGLDAKRPYVVRVRFLNLDCLTLAVAVPTIEITA